MDHSNSNSNNDGSNNNKFNREEMKLRTIRMMEMMKCFEEQFMKGKIPMSEEKRMKEYNEIMGYLDHLYFCYWTGRRLG